MKIAPRVLLFVLLLSACGSSPKTQFYTLSAVPPLQHPSRSAPEGPPIEVGRVHLPASLDRTSVVTRASGSQLKVSDQDRWAASLDELVRRAMTQDLRDRLPSGHVLAPGDPAPAGGVQTLALNVQQFMSDASGHVILAVDWSLERGQVASASHQEEIHVDAAGSDNEVIAEGMSRAVAELSDRIAASL